MKNGGKKNKSNRTPSEEARRLDAYNKEEAEMRRIKDEGRMIKPSKNYKFK